jgi:hypothetical protein
MTSGVKDKQRQAVEMEDTNEIVSFILTSIFEDVDYKRVNTIHKKEQLIDAFSSLLVKYMETKSVSSNTRKLEILKMLDRLNEQKELLDLQLNKINLKDIKEAGRRFGKKAQSAVH